MTSKKSVLSVAIGSAFAASIAAAPLASAAENPFHMDSLKSGYQVVADKGAEGKCGEGKCGASKKDAEGKCGGDKDAEGKCGGDKDVEGKCGGSK